MINIKSNADDIIKQLNDEIKNLDRKVDVVLKDIVEEATENIKNKWPVDSGKSKKAWSFKQDSTGHWVIFNDVDYTQYVHHELASTLVPSEIEKSVNRHMGDLQILKSK